MTLIWIFWIINQYINLIILLNFLIALVSEIYAAVMEKQEIVIYETRADMNREYFLNRRFYGHLKPIKVLAFSTDKEDVLEEEDEPNNELDEL